MSHHYDTLISREFRQRALRVFPFCQWCQTPLAFETSTTDHIKPKSLGGGDTFDNLCLACGPCNERKDSDYAEGMRPRYGPPDWRARGFGAGPRGKAVGRLAWEWRRQGKGRDKAALAYNLLVGGFAVGGAYWCARGRAWYWVVRAGPVPGFNSLQAGQTYPRVQEAKDACRLYYLGQRELAEPLRAPVPGR